MAKGIGNVQVAVVANTDNLIPQVQKGINQAQKAASSRPIVIGANVDFKKFSQPLGRITGDLTQFQSSLDASVARVLAFGASASVLAGVGRAFKEIVSSGIEVEKTLTDINVLLSLSTNQLGKFSDQLFKVAKETSSSFEVAGAAAVEFSRQGLSAEETLKRVKDALILARLAGIETQTAVETLTATVNGFGREALSTTEIINRLATVDSAFAVSSNDLANALARTGAVAQDAGVSFNELIAAVTAVQQTTARGGSVIGNGFKTIFTRIQRSSVRDVLESIGVATSDATGQFRGAIPILSEYARVYQTLTDAQKSYTAEQVAGVFQINTLKALLKDLNSEYSIYSRALSTANNSTDEAYTRNEQLNETLSSLLSRTSTGFKQLGANISNLSVEGPLTNILRSVGSITDALNKALGASSEDAGIGSVIGKSLLGGLAKFISGPGLVIIGGALVKLIGFLGKEVSVAFKQIQNLNFANEQNAKIQKDILALLQQDQVAYSKIASFEGTRIQRNELISQLLAQQTNALLQQQKIAQAVSSYVKSGAITTVRGFPEPKIRGASGGYVPAMRAEKANAVALGASPSVKPMMSRGTIGGQKFVKNSQEVEIPNFGRNGDSAVLPMYSRGYVPNFAGAGLINIGGQLLKRNAVDARMRLDPSNAKYISPAQAAAAGYVKGAGAAGTKKVSGVSARQRDQAAKSAVTLDAKKLGIGAIVGIGSPGFKSTQTSVSKLSEAAKAEMKGYGVKDIFMDNLYVSDLPPKLKESQFSGEMNRLMTPSLAQFSASIYGDLMGNEGRALGAKMMANKGKIRVFSKAAEGHIFESALKLAIGQEDAFKDDDNRPFDFNASGAIDDDTRNAFFGAHPSIIKADAKRTDSGPNLKSFIKKALNDSEVGVKARKAIADQVAPKMKSKAAGYIPNFAGGGLSSIIQSLRSSKNAEMIASWTKRLLSDIVLDGNISPDELSYIKQAADYALKSGQTNLYNYLMGIKPGQADSNLVNGVRVNRVIKGKLLGRAAGFMPALSDAIGREKAAGVPSSLIEVGSSAKFAGPQNPMGLAVTNRRDEPRGVADVRTAAAGFVPNFAREGMLGSSQKSLGMATKLSKIAAAREAGQLATPNGYANKTSSEIIKLEKAIIQNTVASERSTSVTKQATVQEKKKFAYRSGLAYDPEDDSKGGGKQKLDAQQRRAGSIMGLQFAGFALSSAAEQSNNAFVKGGGAALGSGLQTGSTVTQLLGSLGLTKLAGPLGLVTGAASALGSVLTSVTNSSLNAMNKKLVKIGEAAVANTSAAQSYVQAEERLIEARKNNADPSVIIQTQQEANKFLAAISDPKLRASLEASSGSVQKLSSVLADFSRETSARELAGQSKLAVEQMRANDTSRASVVYGNVLSGDPLKSIRGTIEALALYRSILSKEIKGFEARDVEKAGSVGSQVESFRQQRGNIIRNLQKAGYEGFGRANVDELKSIGLSEESIQAAAESEDAWNSFINAISKSIDGLKNKVPVLEKQLVNDKVAKSFKRINDAVRAGLDLLVDTSKIRVKKLSFGRELGDSLDAYRANSGGGILGEGSIAKMQSQMKFGSDMTSLQISKSSILNTAAEGLSKFVTGAMQGRAGAGNNALNATLIEKIKNLASGGVGSDSITELDRIGDLMTQVAGDNQEGNKILEAARDELIKNTNETTKTRITFVAAQLSMARELGEKFRESLSSGPIFGSQEERTKSLSSFGGINELIKKIAGPSNSFSGFLDENLKGETLTKNLTEIFDTFVRGRGAAVQSEMPAFAKNRPATRAEYLQNMYSRTGQFLAENRQGLEGAQYRSVYGGATNQDKALLAKGSAAMGIQQAVRAERRATADRGAMLSLAGKMAGGTTNYENLERAGLQVGKVREFQDLANYGTKGDVTALRRGILKSLYGQTDESINAGDYTSDKRFSSIVGGNKGLVEKLGNMDRAQRNDILGELEGSPESKFKVQVDRLMKVSDELSKSIADFIETGLSMEGINAAIKAAGQIAAQGTNVTVEPLEFKPIEISAKLISTENFWREVEKVTKTTVEETVSNKPAPPTRKPMNTLELNEAMFGDNPV